MAKTPEEIKKALYQCGRGEFRCSECAYYDESEKRAGCGYVLNLHALAYIQQLEEALLLMVYQYCQEDDGYVSHRYMVAGEHAFATLGIENYCSIEAIKKRLDEMEGIHKTPHARTIKGFLKWTNVADHLPPTPGKYLVYSKVGTMYTSTFNPDIHKRWPHFGKVGVTHWMPRPEEPKEE